MLQFEEYKVKLNNLKPEIEGLDKALGIEQAKREYRDHHRGAAGRDK